MAHQAFEAPGVRFLQALVKLVELHQHAGVGLIEAERPLHALECPIVLALLVEQSQSHVAPNGGELRVELGRTLPQFGGHAILALVVI